MRAHIGPVLGDLAQLHEHTPVLYLRWDRGPTRLYCVSRAKRTPHTGGKPRLHARQGVLKYENLMLGATKRTVVLRARQAHAVQELLTFFGVLQPQTVVRGD